MTEEVFLKQRDVQVTKSRFIVPGETYAMSGIISVKTNQVTEKGPFTLKYKLTFIPVTWIVWLIVAQIIRLIHLDLIANLSFLLLLLLTWFIGSSKSEVTKYSVVLRTSSGEVKALESESLDFIQEVTQAINQAMIARG